MLKPAPFVFLHHWKAVWLGQVALPFGASVHWPGNVGSPHPTPEGHRSWRMGHRGHCDWRVGAHDSCELWSLSWGLIMTVLMHLFPQHLTLPLTCRRCLAHACTTSLWGPWVAATPDGQNFLTARRLSSPRARDMDYTCVCLLSELIIYLQCLILFKQTWPHWCPRLFPCQSGPGIKEAQRRRETSHCPPRTVL